MSNKIYWTMLRKKRDELLANSDKTQLSDFPIDSKDKVLYKEYRKYLRELPKLYDESTIKNYKVKNFTEWLDYRKSGNY